MNRLKILLLIALTAASSVAAGPAAARAGWSERVKVLELIPTGRHYYEFSLALKKNPSGCREDRWFYQNYDAPGAGQMFTLLLQSLESDLRVRVFVTGICNINGYAEISSVSATAEGK